MSFPKLVVLEGPDRCGKTTLAKYLARQANAVFLHQTYLGKDAHCGATCEKYHDNILDNVDVNIYQLNKKVILDRHWISEMIYGRVMGRDISGFDWKKKHERIKDMGGIYIICSSSCAVARMVEEKKDEYTIAQFAKIELAYANIADAFGMDGFFKYDLEKHGHNLDAVYTFLCGVQS